jgi:hypothetical protein
MKNTLLQDLSKLNRKHNAGIAELVRAVAYLSVEIADEYSDKNDSEMAFIALDYADNLVSILETNNQSI